MRRTLHLGDVLDAATVQAPTPSHVELQVMDVGGSIDVAVFQHPDSDVVFTLPEAFPGGELNLALGVKTRAWERMGGAVRFLVGTSSGAGEIPQWLLDRTLDPRSDPADRTWIRAGLRIGPARLLTLRTEAVGSSDHAWSGWADPVLTWEGATPGRRTRGRPPRPNVLLVTADACRQDFLSCYGGENVQTPNIDALAAEGVRFPDARTNATSTVASYAMLLTGRILPGGRPLSDWAALPSGPPTLADALGAAGYRTIFASGSQEIGLPERAFGRPFETVIPLLSNPVQDGRVTTRRLLRHLDEIDDRPWFAWACYRETHPPQRMRDDLVRPFYDADPRDPSRAFRSAEIEEVHASETLLYLTQALPLLREGRVMGDLYRRLQATAEALEDRSQAPPDLVLHLRAIGKAARRGRSERGLARWLRRRVRALERGRVEGDLVEWLEGLVEPLADMERDVVGWLEGVVDFRYPLAHLRAGTTLLDRLVGDCVAYLRSAGAYDDTAIVFLAPHGELLGEGNVRFHHAEPREPVLRVPLIIKPPRDRSLGGEVRGDFQLLDLTATLLELLGLDPADGDGVSRASELREGRSIPPHDIVSLDGVGTRIAITRRPYKLVVTRAWAQLDGEFVPAGTRRLYRIDGGDDVPASDAVSADLDEALRRWMVAQGVPETMGLP